NPQVYGVIHGDIVAAGLGEHHGRVHPLLAGRELALKNLRRELDTLPLQIGRDGSPEGIRRVTDLGQVVPRQADNGHISEWSPFPSTYSLVRLIRCADQR